MLNNSHIAATKRLSHPLLLLLLILLAGLTVRLLLLQLRWINPDEGAHLLDARLWLEGQVPVADFGARQPFYIFILALFLKIFAMTLSAARLMPVVASLGVTALLYLFGKRWFGTAVGLTAALIYSLLPLVVIWSTIVKTEQLTILLATASMLLLLVGLEKRSCYLFISGLLAALAFYVRQPALYLPMAAVLFLLISRQNILKNVGLYISGYLSVTAVIFLFYLRHMSLQAILFSQLNPLNLIWNRLLHMLGRLPQEYSIVDDAGFRFLDQDISYTLDSWYHALAFSLFIIIGALGALFPNQFQKGTSQRRVTRLLFCWLGFSALLYLYQTASRGFYTQYFTEMMPPLLILASVQIVDTLKKSKAMYLLLALLATGGFYGIYTIQRFFWQVSPGMVGYAALSVGAGSFLYWYLFRPRTLGKVLLTMFIPLAVTALSAVLLKHLGIPDLYRFIVIYAILFAALRGLNLGRENVSASRILLFISFFFAAFYSGHLIGPRYEAIWDQKTLEKVTAYLRDNSRPSDDILSGGTIWTFESGLAPYLNVPHPTEFYKHRSADFERAFAKNPPRYIIMDGYTERKFSRYKEFIFRQLAIHYEKVLTVEGSKYTVDVFRALPHELTENGFTEKVEDE